MTRLLSGVALAAIAFAAVWLLPIGGLRILACVVALVAAREYLAMIHPERRPPQTVPLMILVALTCWRMSAGRPDVLSLLLLTIVWLSIEVTFRGFAVERAAARFLAPWYLGMPLGMLAAIQALGGRMAAVLLIATVAVSDIAQYYTGRLVGRRTLAPTISPKKTVEGALGGLVAATLFMSLAGPEVLPLARRTSLAALGVLVAALGICGDLFESRLKRIAGVKDSSALIPGHGGALDRIDALLFATPAFYLYLQD